MLYLEGVKKKKKDTVKSFLFKIFDNNKYTNFGNLKNTYYDKNCNNVESIKKNRSLEVYVELLQTYFPKVTEKKIVKSLTELMLDHKGTNKEFGFLYCTAAKKWVVHPFCQQWYINNEFILNYSNSVNKKDEYGDGKYCMNDILKLMKE